MLGVGVPTLREAINQLKAFGTVEVRHGSGVYVGEAIDRLFLINPSPGPLTKRRFLDILETRLLIDPAAAAIAAKEATKAQLAAVGQLLEEERENAGDPAVHFASAFHLETAIASGNTVLVDLARVLMLSFHRDHLVILGQIRTAQEDNRQHYEIFRAIENRDAKTAADLSRQHIDQIKHGVLRSRKVAAVLAELGIE
jgi:GntR family transcriptional repressor for pyruvate dehydrogenase complex